MRGIKFVWENNTGFSTAAHLHLDVRLTNAKLTKAETLISGERDLLERILKVHGVQEATIDRYKVCIERTRSVEWSAITPTVEKIISDYCEKNKNWMPEFLPRPEV